MPLDPQFQSVLRQLLPPGAPRLHELSVREACQAIEVFTALGGASEPVQQIEDHWIAGPAGDIPVRTYTPAGAGPFPLLVYFHGGGWVLCDIQSYDPLCRALASAAGCMVASVGYRLAPEHPFPAAVEDCEVATAWAAARASALGADPTRIGVGGDSAGGNLAAAVALRVRDRGGPALVCQMLIYPVLAYLPELPSYRENDTYPADPGGRDLVLGALSETARGPSQPLRRPAGGRHLERPAPQPGGDS